jgi:hypothetical protein
MEVKILRANAGSRKPQWLIWGGFGLTIFSFFAYFIARIAFAVLMGVGVVVGLVGCIQLIWSYFRK